MIDYNLYIKQVFDSFVFPGVVGGLVLGFSAYILSTGIALGYKLIANAGNIETYDIE